MSKGPGTQISEFTDFIGNVIKPNTHVIVGRREGDRAGMYTGYVLDIHEVETFLDYKGVQHYETKALVEPTGMYSGWHKHAWPTEVNYVTNLPERTGQRPKPNWTKADNIVLSPRQTDFTLAEIRS